MIATIVKLRAPGMALMKMPVFTWTALCTNVLIVAVFPVLTATLVLLSLDRYLDFHFFTNNLRSEEHTSELQSLMRISYAVFCLKKKKTKITEQPASFHFI